MKLSLHCKCGGNMVGTVKPDINGSRLAALFWATHAGDGHGPCDAKTAARARQKSDNANAPDGAEKSTEENLRTLCTTCNTKKGTRPAEVAS